MDAPELGGMPGELNRIAESDGADEPARWAGGASQAPRYRASGTNRTADVPVVGQRGGTQGLNSARR